METDSFASDLREESSDWTGTYTWRVKNWTKLTDEPIYSPEFEVGGYSWRLLVYPQGNETKRCCDHVSVYLTFPEASFTPPQMCPRAKCELIALKRTNSGVSIKRKDTHTFTAQAANWGFVEFLPLQELQNPEAGYLVNEVLTLRVKINIHGLRNLGAISKLKTGFVGIRSLGKISLLSSFLQCLFHIKLFRKAVFQMPTMESDDSQKSLPLALQQLFYNLQYQNTSANIKDLIKALDWDCNDLCLQCNVTGIQRTLHEALNEEDKAGSVMDCISELIMGEYSNYVNSPSIREAQISKQPYIGIPLDAVGGKDIYASLEKFCQTKRLEEGNHEHTTSDRVGESKQYALFDSFPTVLQFDLNQCYYNPDYNAFLKANSNYEFYDELDLDYNDRVLQSKNADRTIENKYRLHSVLVHRSGPNEGHYSAIIRCDEKWYEFDNEVVKALSAEEVINAQFGHQIDTTNANFSKCFEKIDKSTTVFLIYIRKSEWERVMCATRKEDIPKQIRDHFVNKTLKTGEQQTKEDAHLYVNIMLATKLHFVQQSGTSFYFDSTNLETVKNYRIYKKTPFEDFKGMVSEDFRIPKHLQRFWQWSPQTSDNTVRVYNPLNRSGVDLKTVLDLKYFRNKTSSLDQEANALMTIKLFLESPNKASLNGDSLHPIQRNEMLIFLKYYDPELNKLSYLGHMYIDETCQNHVIFEKAKKMAGLAPEEKVIGFEEGKELPGVNSSDLVPIKRLERSHVRKGDIIIIIQKASSNSNFHFPTIGGFLDFLFNRKRVTFRALKNPEDKGFTLCLSKKLTYEQVTNKLAQHLKIDDLKKLRLTKHNSDTRTPYWSPIKYNGMDSLEQMIMYESRYTNRLYYEVLDKPLPYLESVKSFKIEFHNADGEVQSEHQLTLKKDAKVSDLVKALKVELGKGYNDCDMRVMESLFSKFFRVLDPDRVLDTLHEKYWIFRADVIPESQKSLKSDEYLVLFCYSTQDDDFLTVSGNPLWVKVKKDETTKEVKTRVQRTLEISDEEFSHWRFAYCSHPDRPVKYLKDEDKIFVEFPRLLFGSTTDEELFADGVPFIALQRADTRRRNRTTFWRRSSFFAKCLSCIDTLYG